MEDDRTVHGENRDNRSYIANGMEKIINNNNSFEPASIFTISGNSLNSRIELVSDDKKDDEETDSDVISQCIGHIDCWQLFWAIYLCLYQFPTTFHIFCLVFQAASKDFWCSRPEHLKSISVEQWRNLTQPINSCTILDAPYEQLGAFNLTEYFTNETSLKFAECTSWEFDMSLIGKTIISEWNIVCSRGYVVSVVESCFLAGAAIGSISSGWISDSYGRKRSLMVFATIQLVTGLLLGFCESIEMYMIGRVIIGFASMAVVVVSFVLCVEVVSGRWRTIIGILNILPVAIAYIVCAGISYAAYNWRTMQFVISLPTLFLLFLWPYVPESPRWLLSRGNIEELTIMVEKASTWNRKPLPANYKKLLNTPSEESMYHKVSVFDLFKKGFRGTTFLMAIIWFSIILIYFGITLHMSSLGGSIYYNTLIAGFVEACSIAASVFVVLKLGLRLNLFAYLIIAGVACFIINFVRADNLYYTITLAMIVKITIGASNALIPTYTAHHYPVYMRNLGIGAGNLAAGFALVLVPYLFLMGHYDVHLPMYVMGITGIVGAFSLLFIKEKKSTANTQNSPSINNAFNSGE